jgi:hypothetical protein
MSLGGVLLRLMMAGLVHLCVGPMTFIGAFATTEVIQLVSDFATKGGSMTKSTVVSKEKSHKRPIINLGNGRLPLSRDTLPMSL